MSNFTFQDVAGSAVAVVVFALALYVPGYVLGYATDLAGFRGMGGRERSLWAIAYSFSATPLAGYLVAKYMGLRTDCGLLLGLGLIWLLLALRSRQGPSWSWKNAAAACAAGAWIAFVIASLVDIQVGHKLYFSVVEVDQTYRVAFTNSVLHTGVPPANPLYFAGHPQPMRYYYFWYVVCAMVARTDHVPARQAFLASSVWAGFGMVAVLGLYVRYFLGAVEDARRKTLIAIALLAVTGADLLPAIGGILGKTALNGDMEWWSNDPISSWVDSLLWVPHHVASLLCCLVCFLLLWMSRTTVEKRQRVGLIVVAAAAFASAFGLSIYVAFGFALLMLAWVARLLLGGVRDVRLVARIVFCGALSALLLAPFLMELAGDSSRSGAGLPAATGHLFVFSVRRMIDPGLLTGLPLFVAWNTVHPVLLDQVMRVLLLLPGLGLELGFFGVVLWLYARHRKEYAADGAQRTALYLAGCGLALALFVRSAVIGNNDFGYRVALLPQYFLLLLAVDLLASWRSDGRRAVIPQTAWRSKLVYGLVALGVAGTVYQVVMLRIFLPIEAHRAHSEFADLPARTFQVRQAFAELDRFADSLAVVEFNPVDPHPGTGEDVVSPYAFYVRAMMMDADRQILSAEPECAVEFGGDRQRCGEVESATRHLYGLTAPGPQWAVGYCHQFGVEYLAVSDMDPAWRDGAGWADTLPEVVSEPGFRILRCSSPVGSH